MADSYKIMFLGDVVGKPGRNAVREGLPRLQDEHQALFTVINGENSAGGVGITSDIAEDLFKWGADAITLGNHAFHKKEIYSYLESDRPIVRPGNMPAGVPGRGCVVVEREGVRLAVVNACGRVFMDSYDDPFVYVDRVLARLTGESAEGGKGGVKEGQSQIPNPKSKIHCLLDFHAEATSEKIAMGLHLDGRATAVIGTHTHVPTADEQILPGGTAYITDVGMSGPMRSVLGMDPKVILHRFRTTLPSKFEVANEPGVICGVVIDVERDTGRATSINRIKLGGPG